MCLGVPGKIVAITDPERQLGAVDIGGVRREVNLSCVLEEGERLQDLIGEWVVVHVGVALSRIDQEAALWLDALPE
ncbi:MAG: HypC/HybG/HupF family hydrogenase formation chaperone [Methylohalobius sp.]|nr:HypC/HybG/HupF family hydrogenase formation chaperone [Methylohalobius sp.]